MFPERSRVPRREGEQLPAHCKSPLSTLWSDVPGIAQSGCPAWPLVSDLVRLVAGLCLG